MPLLAAIASIHEIARKAYSRALMICYRDKFEKVGKNVKFDPTTSQFSYRNISIGSNVFIGSRAWFSSDRSKIIIGSCVMFGPEVKIFGGDHYTKNLHKPMFFVREKPANLDQDIIIEDDVWVGAGATILKGSVIKKGSIIASGSIINGHTEEYSIYAGTPAKKIKDRFTQDELTNYKKNIENYNLSN